MIYNNYLNEIRNLLDAVEDSQSGVIEEVARLIADCVSAGGIVHVFGSGHSHMMAEELYHRAGGLVPISALLDPNLSSFGLLDSGNLERKEGYAEVILDTYDVRAGEVLIVVSNSGINPVPVEMAVGGKERRATVVAVTSAANYQEVPSRMSDGTRLASEADLVLDTQVPKGDAVVQVEGLAVKTGPASTIIGAALLNAAMVQAVSILQDQGVEPPVLQSQNVPGGAEWNKELKERYRDRLPLLK